jgi:hypothetical protein
MTPAARLAGLLGVWQVSRVLRSTDGLRARFKGIATWAPEGDGLRCDETGTLTQNGTAFPATRTTLWRATTTTLDVAFADGRPFHSFPPEARANARHDCAPDTYDLYYDFTGWPRWSCRWRVTGPRKDYRALTRYRRG